jgi:uncharacterized protein YjbJ (UPF0337 family)
MEGGWKQQRGKAVHQWGKLMNDELAAIAGKYEELVGKLQERYGIVNERSKRQIDNFRKLVERLRRSNAKLLALQKRQQKKTTMGKAGARPSARTVRRKAPHR